MAQSGGGELKGPCPLTGQFLSWGLKIAPPQREKLKRITAGLPPFTNSAKVYSNRFNKICVLLGIFLYQ